MSVPLTGLKTVEEVRLYWLMFMLTVVGVRGGIKSRLCCLPLAESANLFFVFNFAAQWQVRHGDI